MHTAQRTHNMASDLALWFTCIPRASYAQVQVLGDHHGEVVHLFERDCSLQIRNQKVVEFAPAPGLVPELRRRLCDAAVAISKVGGISCAATVEFLVSNDVGNAEADFVFLEVNPRLQVEHTITEEVTGVDIVQSQLFLAAGHSLESLGLQQDRIRVRGSAVQLRLSWQPQTDADAVVRHWQPPGGRGVRVDAACYVGLRPSPAYDPLVAKLICSGRDHKDALARAMRSLQQTVLGGAASNLGSLEAILEQPAIAELRYNIQTLENLGESIANRSNALSLEASRRASRLMKDGAQSDPAFSPTGPPGSPAPGTARLNEDTVPLGRVALDPVPEGCQAVVSDISGAVGEVLAPPGSLVRAGTPVLALTSMKMEMLVLAPCGGVVRTVDTSKGKLISVGDRVATIEHNGDMTANGPEKLDGTGSPACDDAARVGECGLGEDAWAATLETLRFRRERALQLGGAASVAKHHARGRLTIRERIDRLLDTGTFHELGRVAGLPDPPCENAAAEQGFTPGNFVLGTGQVQRRRVVVCGEDFTMQGGSPNLAGLRKSVYAEKLALELEVPLVRLHEGAGGSVGGASGKAGSGTVSAASPVYEEPRFTSVARCLQRVPVSTVAAGAVAGLPASRFVASHFAVMVDSAQVLTAGPKVVSRALGYDVTKEDLGGAHIHSRSGVADNLASSEADAMEQVKCFLSYLPQNIHQMPPVVPCQQPAASDDQTTTELDSIVPANRSKSFDVRRMLQLIVDDGSFFEIGTTEFGASQVTGFARLQGRPIGVMANNCRVLAGAMTANGAAKTARFLELCQTFHIPVVSFIDEPGFMIGVEAELAGTIRHGTRAVLTAAAFPLPFCSVVVRKCYGVAAMAHFAPGGRVLSWPSAERGALPVESGVAVAFARELAAADDPDALRSQLEARFAKGLSPFPSAEAFAVHDLIAPGETRPELCAWLDQVEHTIPRRIREGPAGFGYRG